jgi:hypothetical protein
MLDDMRIPGCDYCGSKNHTWRDHPKQEPQKEAKR